MRFTTAVSLLLAAQTSTATTTSVTASSSRQHQPSLLSGGKNDRRSASRPQHRELQRQRKKQIHNRTITATRRRRRLRQVELSSASGGSPMVNNNIGVMECDPSSVKDSFYDSDSTADVGLLSDSITTTTTTTCSSPGQFCLEDSTGTSSLGGICQDYSDNFDNDNKEVDRTQAPLPRRHLQGIYLPNGVCDPNRDDGPTTYGAESCNCDNFNYETQQGTFRCVIYGNQDVCFDDAGTICGSLTMERTIMDGNGEAIEQSEYCYGFVSPTVEEVCYTYNSLPGCAIAVNGVECTRCEVSNGCYDFDCTNTDAGIEGSDCLGAYVLNALFLDDDVVDEQQDTAAPIEAITSGGGPTFFPTVAPQVPPPTTRPTTTRPTQVPTKVPTKLPTKLPTSAPTSLPTRAPTGNPATGRPTPGTRSPTGSPTTSPTTRPPISTSSPTMVPTTMLVSVHPTTEALQQSNEPSAAPTSHLPTTLPPASSAAATTSSRITTPTGGNGWALSSWWWCVTTSTTTVISIGLVWYGS